MNPDKIQIAVFDGQPVDPFLLDWCGMFSHVEMVSRFRDKDTEPHMAVWRNRVCDWFLRKTTLDALLFLEHSKLPTKSTMGVISSNDDIVGCDYQYCDASGCHPEPGWLGTGCLRMSRHALETIERPWFDYILTEDGLHIDTCSCQWFCRRAMAAGFEPKTVGQIARRGDAVVWPGKPGVAHMQRYEDFCKQNRVGARKPTVQ